MGNENDGIPKALLGAEISLYDGAKTKVKVATHLSEEFESNVGSRSVISFIATVLCHCD